MYLLTIGNTDLIHWLIFIGSALLGFAFAWALFGEYKKKFVELEKLHKTNKSALDRLVTEYSDYKIAIDKSINEKDLEILNVNRELAQRNDYSSNELDLQIEKWKTKYRNLELSNEQTEKSQSEQYKKNINHLKIHLEKAHLKLKKQDALLLNAKRESFPTKDNIEDSSSQKKIQKLEDKIVKLKMTTSNEDFRRLRKANKKLKKKLKKKRLNSKKIKAKKIEFVETLDVKKLMSLIESGELLKRRKSIVLPKE